MDTAKRGNAPDFRINNFDLVRLLAATQVLVSHSVHRLGIEAPWIWLLDLMPGVPIFFAVSGYLVSASLERSRSYPDYARKRAFRIFPGLWACLALTVLVVASFGYDTLQPAMLTWFPAQMAGVIYTPAPLQGFGAGTYNGSLWTIPVELQFYLVLPVIYWLSRRFTTETRGLVVALAGFAALAVAIHYAFPTMYADNETTITKLLRYSFLPHLYMFLWGVVMQRLRLFASPLVAGKGFLWLAFYLVLSSIAQLSPALEVVAMMVLGLTVVSLAYSAPTLSERLLHGTDISYGVYIYHGLALNILIEMGLTGHWEYVPFVLAVAYGLGLASWLLIEKPFLARKSKPAAVVPAE